MWYQIVFVVLSAISLVLCAVTMSIVSSGYQNKWVRELVLGVLLLNFASLCFIVIVKFSPCAESVTDATLQELAEMSPKEPIAPLAGTPTAEVSSEAATEPEEAEFGGIKIENPSKQPFSIMILDQDTNNYNKFVMTNKHKEDVTTSWDTEYLLEAGDAETYFEGFVLVGEKKHPFVFDSEADGKSVKELKI